MEKLYIFWRFRDFLDAEFYSLLSPLKGTLEVVNIFLTFHRSFELPKGFAIFFVSYDISKDFSVLENGRFPNNSMYILHVPSNVDSNLKEDHRATLQFYYPKGKVSPESLKAQVDCIMHEGLEKLYKGLSKAVTSHVVYDPMRYKSNFGFSPNVFNLSPDLSYPRFPIQTQIPGLYCVGDSVAPEGPCVPQAMESGLECARLIAKKIGVAAPSAE